MKTKQALRILLVAAVLAAALGGGALLLRGQAQPAAAQASLISLPEGSPDFARADGPRELLFPRDHGAHPEFQTEWWYYTGNLTGPDGRHFGYQLTFFRRALAPPELIPARESDWATGQAYLAHFALTDTAAGEFRSFERLGRGGAGVAGAQGEPFYKVWLEDWSVQQVDSDVYRLTARQDDMRLELELRDLKGPVLQGDQGYSQKGPQPGNASYYYSQTRLASQGEIETNGVTYPVQGDSWMDHEVSTSALSAGQVGWDWFALQFEDETELMVFNIRQADGSPDPFSSGLFIRPDGSSLRLGQADFEIEPTGTWKSPRSGAVYPAGWIVRVPKAGLVLTLTPTLADQEHNLNFQYWEGAVRIEGQGQSGPLRGAGYVELTGYADSMEGQF